MIKVFGRLAVAALLVAVLGASVAARFISDGNQPSGDTVQPTGSQAVPSQAAAHPNPPASPAQPPTAQASAAGRVVSFQGRYTYADGVDVAVAQVKRSELRHRVVGSKVKKGTPIQVLSLRITNGSHLPVRVAVASATMTYGSHRAVAPAVYNKSITSILGMIAPGRAKTGEYGFAVPKKYLNSARLEFGFDATHLPAAFAGSLDYSPGNGSTFNDPTGSKSDQFAIVRAVVRAVDAAPKGSTIKIAHYSFDIAHAADRLLAAHRRGVHVQMIVDQHEDMISDETSRLMAALGEHRKKKSFIVRCKASCMSNHTSAMHAKFYLFSQVGGSRLVSMVSSANLTHTNSENSWNDMQTVVGDPVFYRSLQQYFKDMTADKNRPHYYRTTVSGQRKLYFFPRASTTKPAVLLDVLKHVSCSGAAPGYGKDGHTLIRVGMYSWTSTRIDIARQLWKLHDSGCEVQVIFNGGRTHAAITQTLLQHSAQHGQMDVYDAWLDRNNNDQPERYMHWKTTLISGVWFGRNAKVSYAGSQNFTPNATVDNNDLILRNEDPAVYDLYAKNFKSIRKHTFKRQW